jgi:2-polyprenyl-3-methyl-5-hydroxy-6-metoxy-1,4-benzoquinol methylase
MPLTEKAGETCPLCGEHQFRAIYTEARDPLTRGSFPVVECAACRMVHTAGVPDCLDRFYPARYRAYGPVVTRFLDALYNLRVSRWARLHPGGGSVLEIGCGAGLMLAAFKRRGWRVLGIERNEAAAEIGRHSLHVEIVSSPVETLPLGAQFDLIIMFQVLEHVRDPIALLKECAKRLSPKGYMVANVPNFSSWQSKFAKAEWFHLDVPRHLNHFTPQTLEATLERAGLKLAQMSFASPEHDPYGWVESTLNRITGHSNTLTRFLMGLDPIGAAAVFSLAFGLVLSPLAMAMAGASWVARQGALVEVIARHPITPGE